MTSAIVGLNRHQCDLESAIGSLRAAAISHAGAKNDQTAIELFQLAEQAKRLRHADVVALLERRRMKLALAQAGAAA